MTATAWLRENSGWLALFGLGITAAGFVLLPAYLHQDVRDALQGADASLTSAPGFLPPRRSV